MKKTTNRYFMKSCAVVLALALAMGLGGCADKAGEETPAVEPEEKAQTASETEVEAEDVTETMEPFSIRVGTMPYYASVPVQVIMDEGLDKKYGFEMTVLNFASGGPMAEALGAGEWDAGPIGAGGMTAIPNYNAYLIYDVESAMDGAWIMARADSDIVKAGSTIADFPDVLGDSESVRGKKILGTIGNISHYMAIDYVEKMGLTMEDVEFLNMETSNVYTAFVSGEGDIACMGSPTAAMKLMDEGYVRIGGLLQQGKSQQDCMLLSEDYYKNNRDKAVAFMAAWLEASEMLNADIDYEVEMCSKFYSAQGRSDFTEEDVRRECEWCAYTDASNYKDKEIGAWMRGLISCYVDAGVMDAGVLEALEQNIATDIIEDAVALMKEKA